MEPPFIILDDASPAGRGLACFAQPRAIIQADRAEQVEGALGEIATAVAAGRHVAGYFSYELGYLLEPRLAPLAPKGRAVPLLWFGVFEEPRRHEPAAAARVFADNARGRAYAGPLQHEWSEADYAARFRRVRRYIEAGDIYQANLSFRSRFRFAGDPLALYASLRTHAGAAHCAYLDDGERQVLSLSPELFFAVSDERRITAKPMKGTAPRGATPQADAAARAHLRASDKERAENLMIVDLLRNDIGRIAAIGSVAVEELFAVETYPTVHQMVSTVIAALRPEIGIGDIVRALFPCGSITGAPKIRAMEIIAELESSPRNVYCGAIGHFAPDGSAAFNVAIRTLTIRAEQGELGIGGAVVHDSRAEAEYAECLLKARYFEAARQPLKLIETLRWSPQEGFPRLELHLSRMAASAATFGIVFDRTAALEALAGARSGSDQPLRLRLSLSEDNHFACAAAPLPPAKASWRYVLSEHSVCSMDVFLQHKTNRRELYEAEHARAAAAGFDEVIFRNERGEITEGSRTNIFAQLDGRLVTPPLTCGLLNGCLRQELVEAGQCTEAVLLPDDLARADAVYVGNSLRGLIPAIRS